MEINESSSEADVKEWLYGIGREAIRPTVDLTVSEWADQYRILAKGGAAEPGPWRTDRTPYAREIMDSLSVESPYTHIVFIKGAQIGATEIGLNWFGYIIHLAPAASMVVWPTEDDIKSNVAVRVKPMFDSTPCVGDRIGEQAGPRDGANNTFMKVFPGGFLSFAASNSTAKLRSKPIRFMMCDEVDEYPGNANQQGDPIALAEARTRTYGPNKKIYLPSTPTIQGSSRIEDLFETTDKRRFYVPCPFCGVYQPLVWDQMRCEKGRPDLAWYECVFCANRIEDFHKSQMLPRGEWRPEKESASPTRIGFHLSALYSPHGMLSWGECMAQYHEALGDHRKLQVWTNTVLGEPFAQKGDSPEWEKLYARRGGYELGTVPEGVLLVTAGVDVQADRIEAEVVGWGRGKESWSLGYFVFMGDTKDFHGTAWNGLRDLMSKGFVHPSTGVVIQIQCAAIDSGYATTTVYNWAREYSAPRVTVIKGQDSLAYLVSSPRSVDVTSLDGKRKYKRALKIRFVGTSILKHELYAWLRLGRDDGKSGAEATGIPGYAHWPDYEEEFFKQLTAEQWIVREVRRTKQQTGEWKKARERNEALDCRIYARAAAAVLNIDMYTGPEWERLEMALGSRSERSDEPHAPQRGPAARPERRRYRSRGVKE